MIVNVMKIEVANVKMAFMDKDAKKPLPPV